MSGAFRWGFPLRVSRWRLWASILHSHCPVLPTEVLRHVPGPQTEISPVYLVNVSRLKLYHFSVLSLLFLNKSIFDSSSVLVFAIFFLLFLLRLIQLHSTGWWDRDPQRQLFDYQYSSSYGVTLLFALIYLFHLWLRRLILLFMVSLSAASSSLSSEKCSFSSLSSFIHQFTGFSNISFALSLLILHLITTVFSSFSLAWSNSPKANAFLHFLWPYIRVK